MRDWGCERHLAHDAALDPQEFLLFGREFHPFERVLDLKPGGELGQINVDLGGPLLRDHIRAQRWVQRQPRPRDDAEKAEPREHPGVPREEIAIDPEERGLAAVVLLRLGCG